MRNILVFQWVGQRLPCPCSTYVFLLFFRGKQGLEQRENLPILQAAAQNEENGRGGRGKWGIAKNQPLVAKSQKAYWLMRANDEWWRRIFYSVKWPIFALWIRFQSRLPNKPIVFQPDSLSRLGKSCERNLLTGRSILQNLWGQFTRSKFSPFTKASIHLHEVGAGCSCRRRRKRKRKRMRLRNVECWPPLLNRT